jgi:hypothetical protein
VTADSPHASSHHSAPRLLARKNVLAGLMFVAVAALGLWVSRNYPVGTALRMGTGYMPRFLCWTLMGLGAVVLVQGLREPERARAPQAGAVGQLVPIVVVTTSLVAFALTLEQLGLALAILILIGIGALAARGIRFWEVVAAAVGLVALSWAIFILGLGLPIPIWPDF